MFFPLWVMKMLTLALSNEMVRNLINKPERLRGPLPPGRYYVEPKYDGERELILRDGDVLLMANRYATVYEPEMLPNLFDHMKDALPNGLFDAELVVLPKGTVYDLMKAVRNGRDDNLCLMIFDVLRLDGEDVRGLPLSERKHLLEKVVKENDMVKLVPYELVATHEQVERAFRDFVSRGFEGIVVKTDGTYHAPWFKMKKAYTVDLVVLGFRRTKEWEKNGVPASFLVGYYDGSKFVPLCHVASGLSWAEKKAIGEFFRKKRLITGQDRKNVYVKPILVLEIEYQELSENGKLRHPRIKRIRWDKAPTECLKPS